MAFCPLCYLEFRLPQDCSRTVGGRSTNPTVPGRRSTAQAGTTLTFSGSFRPCLCGSFNLSLSFYLLVPGHVTGQCAFPFDFCFLIFLPRNSHLQRLPRHSGFSSGTFPFLKNPFSLWHCLLLQVLALTRCVLDLCRLELLFLDSFSCVGLGS